MSDDTNEMLFIIFAFVGLLAMGFWLGFGAGKKSEESKWKKTMVSIGYASYDSKTGEYAYCPSKSSASAATSGKE